MKISDLELYLVEVPRSAPLRAARNLLVRLTTDSGLEGWGEAAVPWRASELSARRDRLMATLAGRSVFDIEERLSLDLLQSAPLACALEIASWDVIGRAASQPVCHFFGGVYRNRIPVAARLPSQSPGEAARLAKELAELGFHKQIVTAHGSAQHDAATVAAVREAAGDRADLYFDGAAGYDRQSALDLCAQLGRSGLTLFIDPLRQASFEDLAALRREIRLPLGISMALSNAADVLAVVRCRAAEFIFVDPQRVGGMVPARKCAAVAEAASMSAALAAPGSVGVLLAAALQLGASTPAFASGIESDYHQLHDDVLAEPIRIVDGMIPVPHGKGLGIEVDRAKLERFQAA